jgi:ABC-type transporter Mla maintaining outer membrane lipid asymmetry ATPase subunit MlaF
LRQKSKHCHKLISGTAVNICNECIRLIGQTGSGKKAKVSQLVERPIIQFYSVFKKFGTNEVLRGVSLRIFQGQVTTIIGKSGGGKSVLLKHIIGLLQPDAGEILLYGQPLSKMKLSQINRLRARFSYVFQDEKEYGVVS